MTAMMERIGDGAMLSPTAQVGAVAAASRELGELRGSLLLAREFPRDEMKARAGALESCSRPEFCMKEDGTAKAIYSYKRGQSTVSGPGVVLARELARRWGNLRFGIQELPEEDPTMVHLRAQAMDMETNLQVVHEDRFSKKIQRKGQGWVEPDERDLRELKNRRGAFLARNCLLQLLPPDLVDLSVSRIHETMTLAAAGDLRKDRAGTILKLLARFSGIGVVRAQIEAFIGAPLDDLTAEQRTDLLGAYQSIADNVQSVGAVFPTAEPDGAAALRARIAELEAKATNAKADPFEARVKVEPANDATPPETAQGGPNGGAVEQAPVLSEQTKAALREQLKLGDQRAPTPGPAFGDPDPAEQAAIRAAEMAEAAQDAPGSTSGAVVRSPAPLTKAELQAAITTLEVGMERSARQALRDAAGIKGLSIATVAELAAYLEELEGSVGQAEGAV
jgi:hypothetical protein